MKNLFKGLSAFGLGMLAAGTAVAQQAPARAELPEAPKSAENARIQGVEIERQPGDLPGPIDSFHDVQDSLKMAFMAADQNHDGLISQKEATDAGNVLVGGLFFSADANGDGAVSREEAQAARKKVFDNNPILRFVLQRAKDPNQKNMAGSEALKSIRDILDGNGDQKLQATELRQAITSAVQGLFAVADTNRDNQISPAELNASVFAIAQAAAQSAFQQADADNSGGINKEEFHKGLVQPADVAFDILDANLDGELTQQELDRAARVLANQLQMFEMPEASNSLDDLLRTGRRPNEVAPPANVNATRRAEPVRPANPR